MSTAADSWSCMECLSSEILCSWLPQMQTRFGEGTQKKKKRPWQKYWKTNYLNQKLIFKVPSKFRFVTENLTFCGILWVRKKDKLCQTLYLGPFRTKKEKVRGLWEGNQLHHLPPGQISRVDYISIISPYMVLHYTEDCLPNTDMNDLLPAMNFTSCIQQ